MKTHNIYVVAPDTQKSATGHAITIHNPIMVNEEYIDENIKAYSISGTPADCVKIGIEALLKDINIDISIKWNKQWTKLRDRCYIFWNSICCNRRV